MKVVVAGATGLVGTYLLKSLAEEAGISHITALSRRSESAEHSKVAWQVVDYENVDSLNKACKGAEAAFCCLGTTMAKAGSQEAFRKIDHDYVLTFAEASLKAGAKQFHMVSAIGASAQSSIFYNRVKGETEEALSKLNFSHYCIYRPGFLRGDRREVRRAEQVGGWLMQLFSPLMAGRLSKYKTIHGEQVAAAMTREALSPKKKLRVLQYREMTGSETN